MSMAIKYAMGKKARKMADGGEVKPVVDPEKAKLAAASMRKAFGSSDTPDKADPVSGDYAKGGSVECMACKGGTCMEHGGMVDRIMAKRMAQGGEVMADEESNDFDYLDQKGMAHDADYTGANSGDEHGNEEMDENDRDLISRIMRSRAKKDKMPRPA